MGIQEEFNMARTFEEKRLFVAMKKYDEIREYLDSNPYGYNLEDKRSELNYYEDLIAKIMVK